MGDYTEAGPTARSLDSHLQLLFRLEVRDLQSQVRGRHEETLRRRAILGKGYQTLVGGDALRHVLDCEPRRHGTITAPEPPLLLDADRGRRALSVVRYYPVE